MPALVVDASVTVCWLLPDETNPRANVAWAKSQQYEAAVPQIWHPEVRNALYQAERRGRITPSQTESSFERLNVIPVVTDTQPDYDVVLTLARMHNLSLYDAMYLELAKRYSVELATLDAQLGEAAAKEGLLMTTS